MSNYVIKNVIGEKISFVKNLLNVISRTHRLFPFLPSGSEGSVVPELRENDPVLSVIMGV